MLRQPIVVVLGHVDHGKTSLLDAVRKTRVQAREAGAITQHIGASEVPVEVIRGLCSQMLEKMKIKLTIPGLLFIDTPGHEAFTNLRKRGGSIADVAILVIDVRQGIQPQTVEAIEILREYKTPFVIALTKIDSIKGWSPQKNACFTDFIAAQRKDIAEELDESIYKLIGKLFEFGFEAERFDRVGDFTKTLAIVPVSGVTGEGIQELLVFISGLAQKYLEKQLELHDSEPGKGSILEVREEAGLGKTLDVILYDGVVKQGDDVVFASVNGPVVGKVKALLKPKPLDEMRDPRQKFSSVEKAWAASGVKIACENADAAIPGSSILVAIGDGSAQKEEIERELNEISFDKSELGVVLKADALGSLEAITRLLAMEKIPLKKAEIGGVSKKDASEANAVKEKDVFLGVVLAFNVPVDDGAKEQAHTDAVKIFEDRVIYNLIEGYKNWRTEQKVSQKREAFKNLIYPAKILLLEKHCFHIKSPCIFGVEVLEGKIRKGSYLMDADGGVIGKVKSIQKDKETVDEAGKGAQLAISMDEPVYGKDIFEKQVLYSSPMKDDVALLQTKYAAALTDAEKELLKDIKKIKGFSAF